MDDLKAILTEVERMLKGTTLTPYECECFLRYVSGSDVDAFKETPHLLHKLMSDHTLQPLLLVKLIQAKDQYVKAYEKSLLCGITGNDSLLLRVDDFYRCLGVMKGDHETCLITMSNRVWPHKGNNTLMYSVIATFIELGYLKEKDKNNHILTEKEKVLFLFDYFGINPSQLNEYYRVKRTHPGLALKRYVIFEQIDREKPKKAS